MGDDRRDPLLGQHRIQRSREHGLHDLVDLSVRTRVEILQVLPKPRQQPTNRLRHPRHPEIRIGLACARGRGSVARIAEAGDRVAGLLTGDLRCDRTDLISAAQQFDPLAALRLRRRLEARRVSVGPHSPDNYC
ncbi:hypothetical protein [Mycolicibacter sinensis]|uniref:hypothetical protein n=1 Tax=Mycolicibacter sinensis (strain JDM601) TaxID=875328 RepID=UPI00104230F3|nr:hypothetical protein [Mycolicibacter sinensis]